MLFRSYDIDGNVSEWVDTIEDSLVKRVYRGGNYSTTSAGLLSARNIVDPSYSSNFLGFRICSRYASNKLPDPNFVLVSDPNNAPNSNNYGSVDYLYYIGKYEITNDQYINYLNNTAKTDTYLAYDPNMSSDPRGGIIRSGSAGSYVYSAKPNMGNKPAIYINWFRAARYCNWLHNNKPSYGRQDIYTTEDGAYHLCGANQGIVPRQNNALYWIPTEDEWIKAGYYKGNGINNGYYNYATQNDSVPACVNSNSDGSGPYCAYNSDNVCVAKIGRAHV